LRRRNAVANKMGRGGGNANAELARTHHKSWHKIELGTEAQLAELAWLMPAAEEWRLEG